MMNIKIKKEKDVLKLLEIKQIENIKCSSKAITFLIKLYDDNLRLQNEITKKRKEIERLSP